MTTEVTSAARSLIASLKVSKQVRTPRTLRLRLKNAAAVAHHAPRPRPLPRRGRRCRKSWAMPPLVLRSVIRYTAVR
jgi:hypothetical protein